MQIPTSFPYHLHAMLKPAFYPHATDTIRVIETHISWVILTGVFVYKVKKHLKLDFLDFSTLEQRKHYCQEELRLNRQFAPDYYLDVVTITQQNESIALQGHGQAIEYALKMKHFADNCLLNQLIRDDKFTSDQLDQLASSIANIHQNLPRADKNSRFGDSKITLQAALDNFSTLEKLIIEPEDQANLNQLHNWTLDFVNTNKALFEERKEQGFIRECHGDLHLGNITVSGKQVIAFDCIEFNEAFRWIDVINDIAFLVMDLHFHQHPEFARRLLNQYLEITGDYSGLKLMKFYLVYRALVRCKVEAIQQQQKSSSDNSRYQTYLKLAKSFSQEIMPKVIITYGLSGSGKTVLSQLVIENSDTIRIRSDVERKRIFGLNALEKSNQALKSQMYSQAATHQTYQQLAHLTEEIITAGYNVIIDATFLQKSARDFFHQLANRINCAFIILHTLAPISCLKKWIAERQTSGKDASEATIEILEQQLAKQEPLDAEEKKHALEIHTDQAIDISQIIKKISFKSST